jgi:probable F420-dependent oxidoreductase
MRLGPVGVWTAQLDGLPATQAHETAAELEELGYGAIWVPEAIMREAFTNSMLLLGGTSSIAVATGVANIWLRAPQAAAAAHRTVSEAHPGRFLLGLGVSHAPMVEGLLHQRYERPLTAMKHYLDEMDTALVMTPEPAEPPERVLAALGPKMLELAAAASNGAHTYNVTPEHTAFAREHLGPDALLAPEQAVVLESDQNEARRIGRAHLAIYVGLPNYTDNLRRFGFTDDDFSDGGSDRLVDALVAWGDEDRIAERVRAHHAAGADHVAVQVLSPAGLAGLPADEWRRLAPALLA